jgi:hypothetical protein
MLFGYLFVLPAFTGQTLLSQHPRGAIDIETIENSGL